MKKQESPGFIRGEQVKAVTVPRVVPGGRQPCPYLSQPGVDTGSVDVPDQPAVPVPLTARQDDRPARSEAAQVRGSFRVPALAALRRVDPSDPDRRARRHNHGVAVDDPRHPHTGRRSSGGGCPGRLGRG